MVVVGVINVGLIEILFEFELKINLFLLGQQVFFVVIVQKYGVDGEGFDVKVGDEVVVFNLGFIVVFVFEVFVGGEGFNVGLQ